MEDDEACAAEPLLHPAVMVLRKWPRVKKTPAEPVARRGGRDEGEGAPTVEAVESER
jgi:hypothetical protein